MTQFVGASLRAFVMMVLVAMPALMLPGTGDTDYFAALACLAVGGLVMAEYTTTCPGLIEFRDAPPYNRIRALTALSVLFGLSVVGIEVQGGGSTLAVLLAALGHGVGGLLDFPFSPVRLMLLSASDSAGEMRWVLQCMLGLAFVIGAFAVICAAFAMRVMGWPLGRGRLNLWTNLPFFDPIAGDDVAERLRKSAAINYSFAFLSPFIVALGVEMSGDALALSTAADLQTMVWVVTVWVLAPVCLAMRAMALARIADMIEAQRRTPAASPALS